VNLVIIYIFMKDGYEKKKKELAGKVGGNTYLSSDSRSPGKGNRTTGAQRRNARMDKIWEKAREHGAI
jgi:hypothetical protein